MTNLQIIANEAIANNLYTEEQVEELFATNGCLPLFTFAEWKKAGYFVRKGEKAKLTCYIWKKKKGAKVEEENATDEQKEREFFMCKAFFFTPEQVEKAVKAGA